MQHRDGDRCLRDGFAYSCSDLLSHAKNRRKDVIENADAIVHANGDGRRPCRTCNR
jgi:hypothetical protein